MAKPPKAVAAKKPRAKTIRRNDDKKLTNRPPAKAVKKTDKRGTPKGKGTVVTKRGGPIGNPRFKPTDEQKKIVETHAACGTPHWLIALELKIGETTLYQYFRYELDTGLLRLNARIGSLVAKQALSGCKSSQALWLKSRGGWSDKLLLATPAGESLQLAAAPRNPDLKSLTDEEVLAYRRIQAKLEGISDDRQL